MYSFHVPLHSHNPSLRRDPVSGEGKTDHDLLFLLMTKLLLGEKLNEPDENQYDEKSQDGKEKDEQMNKKKFATVTLKFFSQSKTNPNGQDPFATTTSDWFPSGTSSHILVH
jgi:hypothetical protein